MPNERETLDLSDSYTSDLGRFSSTGVGLTSQTKELVEKKEFSAHESGVLKSRHRRADKDLVRLRIRQVHADTNGLTDIMTSWLFSFFLRESSNDCESKLNCNSVV